MRRPLKWVVPVQDAVQMIGAGPVISVMDQPGVGPCVWTLEETLPSTPEQTRAVMWAGTGHSTVPDAAEPLGSVMMHDGALVFHLFDVTPEVG